MADDYHDFEWRFQKTLKEHREKLEALSAEKRAIVENDLRERYREHEEEITAIMKKEDWDIHNDVDRSMALDDAYSAYTKSLIDQTHERQEKQQKDTPEKAWGRFQERQKGADHDHERER
jgi:hypothetical protein